jgi:hypothetical protein
MSRSICNAIKPTCHKTDIVIIGAGAAVELGAQWLAKSKQHRLEGLAKKYDAQYQANHYEGLPTHILCNTLVKSISMTPPMSWFEYIDVFQIDINTKVVNVTQYVNQVHVNDERGNICFVLYCVFVNQMP